MPGGGRGGCGVSPTVPASPLVDGGEQGWELTHRFFERIARVLREKEWMSDLLKKMSDSLIHLFLVSYEKRKKNPAEHQGLIKIICSPSKSRETIPLNHPITSEFICIFTLWMGASSEFQSKHLFLQSKLCVLALPHSKFCFVFLYCFPRQKLLHS